MAIILGYPSTAGEYTAELSCSLGTNQNERLVRFSELSPDQQQKVKRAIENDAFVNINASQEEYFEAHPHIQYRNETYICRVVRT